MSQRHENVVAWKRADDLCVAIYRLTRAKFPAEERYGLTAQMRRAAYSVAANIVEGYGFESRASTLRFLRIAAASLAEVGYGVHLAARLELLTPSDLAPITAQIAQTAAPLHGLIRHFKRARTTPRRV
jgi:four helix bundle protein